MKKIGVIGAGVMGRGVAQRFASEGKQVLLIDIRQEILDEAIKEITRNLKVQSMMNKNLDIDMIRNNIITTLDYSQLSDVDYVVENVPEVVEIKRPVYAQLSSVCKEKCIFMVNTSCVPITLISKLATKCERVIGVHFMNPVPMKNFAEVIKGWDTSEEVIEDIRKLLEGIGIEIEVVNDSPGFVTNRVSHVFMNEAAFLVYEGVATPKQVDNIFKKAFGHKMGPLETADLIGIDTVLKSLKVLYEEYEDSKYRACPLLKRMVENGKLGRKSREGFYCY